MIKILKMNYLQKNLFFYAKKILLLNFLLYFFGVNAQTQSDFEKLKQQSLFESLKPIRKGTPNGQAFWNENAVFFIYAPAFDFKNTTWLVTQPKYFRYTAFSFTDKKEYIFTEKTPFEALTPIWDKLPNGKVYLKVEAISTDEKNSVLSGSRFFYKAASFSPPYPPAQYSFNEALRLGLNFMYNQEHIQNWLKTGKPDHENHSLYCYSALEVGSVINGMILYHKVFPQNDSSLQIAKKGADYLIQNSEKKGSPLEFFPQVYEGKHLTAEKFGDEIILTEPAATGMAYLSLFEQTNDKKYFDAARRIADTYLKNQLTFGTWYIRINKKTGKPTSTELCIPLKITNFLTILVEKYQLTFYKNATDKAIKWIWENPMKTFNWTGQFEDVEAAKPYQNLTKYEASWFAQFLLNHSENDSNYLPLAKELIAFCEDQFVVWETPNFYDNWGNSTVSWHTPAVLEQYKCYVPIDASAVQMIETFYLAYKKTGEMLYYQKALALANSLVNSQKENGQVPTFWANGFTEFWNNCMVSSLNMLQMMQ